VTAAMAAAGERQRRRAKSGTGGWSRAWIGALLGVLCLAALASPRPASAVSYQGERDLGARFDLSTRQRVPMIDRSALVPPVMSMLNGLNGFIGRVLALEWQRYS